MTAASDPPVVVRARLAGGRIALDAPDGRWTYPELLSRSARVATALLADADDLAEARVAYLVEPGVHHAATLWGIWRAGGIAVPLATSHPPAEHEHALDDSGASLAVTDTTYASRLLPLARERGIRCIDAASAAAEDSAQAALPSIDETRRALMIYTSGTTARPKGAVHTHRGLRAQMESLVSAWEWSADDRILLALPLHHVHGLINILGCALWSGARCDVLPAFDADEVWERIARRELTLFMAVPTIYARLIAAWEAAPAAQRQAYTEGCRAMRLMVSGSAALPVPTLERWRDISGHVLLERYGMTEIGMALSNPLHGERRPGHVGTPLPGVEARLVDDTGRPVEDGSPGEIEVRGPTVFQEYWDRPAETAAAFRDGWFRTGDVAVVDEGAWRILGRSNIDILKTGGYKVSALEIEDVLRGHPDIADCAVVGLPDAEWGERVGVALVPRAARGIDADAVREWAREHLAPYKVPRVLRVVAALPRNAMGKVTKPAVRTLLQEPPA